MVTWASNVARIARPVVQYHAAAGDPVDDYAVLRDRALRGLQAGGDLELGAVRRHDKELAGALRVGLPAGRGHEVTPSASARSSAARAARS